MTDPIESLAARFKRMQSKEREVREHVALMAAKLAQVFPGDEFRGKSNPVLTTHPREPSRGLVDARLEYRRGQLLVTFSARLKTPSFMRPVSVEMPLEECSQSLLDGLFQASVMESLLQSIGGESDVKAREENAERTLGVLRTFLRAEAIALDTEMTDSLEAASDDTIAQLWRDAADAVHYDSADALTRCSRFLEAVCAKILRERGVALPKDKSLSPLVKACLETLTWPAEKEAEGDVRQLLGGIQSITNGIGALRTHFGTAHGATSHLPPLDRGYAVFVKQATVAAATFLLDRHQAGPVAVDDSSPAPEG
ncbi:abortive infection family protein [Burkholderia gladioli]|uniref:abortive infection family protein n=1 Tax=Burkholderia gladioli TaxID=28095 RepID=UPI001641EF99|nr:abortive infection family protein [Burkholderia gladioli]